MSEDTGQPEWTASRIFGQIVRRFVGEGLRRGAIYGGGFGALFGPYYGPIGLLYGIPMGLILGALLGLGLGIIGGCFLGVYSAWWRHRQRGIISNQAMVDWDEYRAGVIRISVGTPLIIGLLINELLIFCGLEEIRWITVGITMAPVLIAAIAAYQAALKISDWYELQVDLPRNLMRWDETAQAGVWPPPPLRPEDS